MIAIMITKVDDIDTENSTISAQEAPSSSDASSAKEMAVVGDEDASVKSCVLIVHASVGSGHRSAAYAIASAFELLSQRDRFCTESNGYSKNII